MQQFALRIVSLLFLMSHHADEDGQDCDDFGAGPSALSPQQKAEVEAILRQRTEGGSSADVMVVSHHLPEGVAGSFLSAYGPYPDHTMMEKLKKVYLKAQPGLRGFSEFSHKAGQAVRNARAHIGRLLKAVMATLFENRYDELRDKLTVRLCALHYA